MLDDIQHLFNVFIWDGKRPSITAGILPQEKEYGGVALPNVVLYYRAALLEAPR